MRRASTAAVTATERIVAVAPRTQLGRIERRERSRADELRAQPLAKLLRRGDRVGDREDLPDRQLALDDEPRVQQGEREGLAGARARLDAVRAFERPVEQCRGHATFPGTRAAQTAANSRLVQSRNSAVAVSSTNGIAPRNASSVAASLPSPPPLRFVHCFAAASSALAVSHRRRILRAIPMRRRTGTAAVWQVRPAARRRASATLARGFARVRRERARADVAGSKFANVNTWRGSPSAASTSASRCQRMTLRARACRFWRGSRARRRHPRGSRRAAHRQAPARTAVRAEVPALRRADCDGDRPRLSNDFAQALHACCAGRKLGFGLQTAAQRGFVNVCIGKQRRVHALLDVESLERVGGDERFVLGEMRLVLVEANGETLAEKNARRIDEKAAQRARSRPWSSALRPPAVAARRRTRAAHWRLVSSRGQAPMPDRSGCDARPHRPGGRTVAAGGGARGACALRPDLRSTRRRRREARRRRPTARAPNRRVRRVRCSSGTACGRRPKEAAGTESDRRRAPSGRRGGERPADRALRTSRFNAGDDSWRG